MRALFMFMHVSIAALVRFRYQELKHKRHFTSRESQLDCFLRSFDTIIDGLHAPIE